jgi:hypothetical protein
MEQSKATVLVIALLSLLAVFVTVVSILILIGGKVYHKIPQKSRPEGGLLLFFSHISLLFALGSLFRSSTLTQLSRTSWVSFLVLSPSSSQLGTFLGNWGPSFCLSLLWSNG